MITNYNNGSYINQCLQSIIDQNIKYDYNIFIIDDCSTDNSVEVINNFIEKNKNINIFFEKNEINKGTLYSSIKLYEKITNKYWTIIDSDDYWLPNFINDGLDILIKDNSLGTYSTNTKLLTDNEFKNYFPTRKKNKIYLNNIPYFTHTSSTIFSKKYFENGVPELFYKAYDIDNKFIRQAWEGDTARNFLWAYNCKNYLDLTKFGGVYRIIQKGNWTKLNRLEKKLVTISFKTTALYFSKKYDFFKINQNSNKWVSNIKALIDRIYNRFNRNKEQYSLEIETCNILYKMYNDTLDT